MMDSGRLRHRVTLQQRSGALDPLGQPSDDWEDVATTWATVQPISGRELEAGKEIAAEITHKVWLRWRRDWAPMPGMRVLIDGGRVLDIESAINVNERKRVWLLLCRERM